MVDNPEETPQSHDSGKMVARNTAFGVGAQVALKVAGFFFSVLIIRNLGNSAFGQYSIVLAWAGIFSVFGDMGISQYLTREIARDSSKASEYFWDVVSLRLILSVLATILTVVGAVLYGYSTEIVLGIGLYTLTFVLQAFLQPLFSVLIGNERIDVTSIFGVLGQIMFMVIGGLFLLANLSFVWLVGASIIYLPVILILTIWIIRRNNLTPPRFKISPSSWRPLLIAGFPFAMIQVSLSFAFDSDTIILSRFRDDQEVGWYATAYRLMTAFFVFYQPFNSAVVPTLTKLHAKDPDALRPWYYRSVKVMLLFSLAIAIGGTLLSDQIITFLYTSEVLPASIAFAILTWYLPVQFYTAFAGNLATTMKQEAKAARIYAFEGILNIVLNLILIPSLGLVGASLATVLTMLAGSALFYVLFRRILGPGLDKNRLMRMAAAGILMGVVVLLLRNVNLFVAIAGGGITYLGFSYVLGVFTAQELSFAFGLLNRFRPKSSAVAQQP